ncbi:MAG TPA: hypothetical protein VND92_01885 [Vicinamibacterales bacterium]|nr:hypothetical protein [Vicinamibacterales bacterium]
MNTERPEPFPLMGFARLFRMAMAGQDLVALRTELIQRAAEHPDDANTLLDVSYLLQLTWQREVALDVQAQALKMQQLYHLPAPSGHTGLRLLALMGPGDLMANTPIECLLEDSDVALDLLYLAPGTAGPAAIPDHDILLVAIGENDQNRGLLAHVDQQLRNWPRPVLNRADRIQWLSREGVCDRLHDAPGIAMPITARVSRSTLEDIGAGAAPLTDALADGVFPIIARPAGSHAGQGLEKLVEPAAIRAYLDGHPDEAFCLTRFVDYRGPDGLFRKYRIAMIDGRPFVCHVGIAAHWMIHYLNAGMAESAEKRAEEARIMETFDQDFARRHAAAFHAIQQRLGMDYLGVDCGETPDGRLLVFEADNCMIVHAMDPVDLYPYKQPQMRKVFDAFTAMLTDACARGRHRIEPIARRA